MRTLNDFLLSALTLALISGPAAGLVIRHDVNPAAALLSAEAITDLDLRAKTLKRLSPK